MNTLSSFLPVFPYVNTTSNNGQNGSPAKETSDKTAIRPSEASGQGLNAEDLKKLTELKARDREVRTHESAHQAAGGQHAGAMSLTYERGPDGAQYAVSGEVSIDVAPVAGNPQATIEKMRTVRAAAMAPAQPSSQDRAVASQAMQTMLQAQSEISVGENSDTSSATETKDAPEEDSDQSLSSRQADDTYRSVFALTDEQDAQQSSFLDISI